MSNEFMTPKELATRYKVSEGHITNLARSGILPGIKIGHVWRFKAADIEEWERHQGYHAEEVGGIVREIMEGVDNNVGLE